MKSRSAHHLKASQYRTFSTKCREKKSFNAIAQKLTNKNGSAMETRCISKLDYGRRCLLINQQSAVE